MSDDITLADDRGTASRRTTPTGRDLPGPIEVEDISVGVAYLDLGLWRIVLAVTIAAVKALLVILYFMHARYSSRLIWLFAGVGFAWLGIMIVLTMSDYLSRGWLQ